MPHFREFELASELPENQDASKRFAIHEAEAILLKAGVSMPLGISVEEQYRIEANSQLDEIGEMWKSQPHTPEVVVDVNRRIFEVVKDYIGIPFSMPEAFPADTESIVEHEAKGENALYLPAELSTDESRGDLLGAFKIFDKYFDLRTSPRASIISPKNVNQHSGWRWISATPDVPNLGISPANAKRFVRQRGYEGIDLNEYMMLGLFMKSTTGAFPDSRISRETMLLNSKDKDWFCCGGRFEDFGIPIVFGFRQDNEGSKRFGIRMSAPVKPIL